MRARFNSILDFSRAERLVDDDDDDGDDGEWRLSLGLM
jgi:hypothetical protein